MPEISNSVSSRIFYRKMGAGPAVILLHGFPESSTVWRDIWDKLSLTSTLIMPDFPGSGGSGLDKATGIGDMAECIKDIMVQEHIEKAVIAGHSMGGYAGFEFAARYPGNVAGLSLIHSAPFADDEEKKSARRKSIEIIRNGGKNAFINQMVPNLFSGDFKQTNPQAVKRQVEQALGMDDTGLINFYDAMIRRTDHSEMLKQVSYPVQWIAGANDLILDYKKIIGLSHVSCVDFISLYNNCGHMSMLEAPERLSADLKEFVNYCDIISPGVA
jgi:pimeloyl-ACP methyl ester carboxylesterase